METKEEKEEKKQNIEQKADTNDKFDTFKGHKIRMIGTVGCGTYGAVHLVEDLSGKITDKKYFAIKQIKISDTSDREYKALDKMKGLCNSLDYFGHEKIGSVIRFGMECVGCDIFDWHIDRGDGLRYEQCIEYIVYGALKGTHEMHEVTKITHRDLKLGNLGAAVDGEIKILDLGTANDSGSCSTHKVGTKIYMAHEVAMGGKEAYSNKCDIWALGIVIVELLFGVCQYIHDLDEKYKSKHNGEPMRLGPLYKAVTDFTSKNITKITSVILKGVISDSVRIPAGRRKDGKTILSKRYGDDYETSPDFKKIKSDIAFASTSRLQLKIGGYFGDVGISGYEICHCSSVLTDSSDVGDIDCKEAGTCNVCEKQSATILKDGKLCANVYAHDKEAFFWCKRCMKSRID